MRICDIPNIKLTYQCCVWIEKREGNSIRTTFNDSSHARCLPQFDVCFLPLTGNRWSSLPQFGFTEGFKYIKFHSHSRAESMPRRLCLFLLVVSSSLIFLLLSWFPKNEFSQPLESSSRGGTNTTFYLQPVAVWMQFGEQAYLRVWRSAYNSLTKFILLSKTTFYSQPLEVCKRF